MPARPCHGCLRIAGATTCGSALPVSRRVPSDPRPESNPRHCSRPAKTRVLERAPEVTLDLVLNRMRPVWPSRISGSRCAWAPSMLFASLRPPSAGPSRIDNACAQQFLDHANISTSSRYLKPSKLAPTRPSDGSTSSGGRAARQRNGSASWPKSAQTCSAGHKQGTNW